jgi:hypothetical protein
MIFLEHRAKENDLYIRNLRNRGRREAVVRRGVDALYALGRRANPTCC